MFRIKIKQYLLFLLTLLLTTIFVVAQEQSNQTERRELNNCLLNCEMSPVYQEDVIRAALEQTKRGGVLIVLARLGDGENSRELNRRRLYNVREYLKERGGLAADKIVVAEGERVKGNGRLEYYLGGNLFEQILFGKNGYTCHSCCGPDERYYPEKAIYELQQKQKQKRKRRG